MSVELSSRRRMRGRIWFNPPAPALPDASMDPRRIKGRSLSREELLLSSNKRRRRMGLLIRSAPPAAPPPRPPPRTRRGRRSFIELEVSSFNRVIKRRGDPKRSVDPPNPPPFIRVMIRMRSESILLSSSRRVMRRRGFERRSPPIPAPPCDMRMIGRRSLRDEEVPSLSRREMRRKVFMSSPAATSVVLALGTAILPSTLTGLTISL